MPIAPNREILFTNREIFAPNREIFAPNREIFAPNREIFAPSRDRKGAVPPATPAHTHLSRHRGWSTSRSRILSTPRLRVSASNSHPRPF